MRKLFKKQFLPILLLAALLGNIIIPNMMPTGIVYAAEEKTEVLMEAAVMSAGSEVVLGNDSIMINGIKYLNSELKSLLSKATITRLEFNPAMAQRMIDFAKAAGMIITPTVLKSIGVAVAGVFITMAVILALSALAYYAYEVVMEDGNIFNLSFLPDSVFIGDTQITGFTKSIAEMTNFFETRMKENPNEEVAKPEGGTDTGEAEKPGEGESDADTIAIGLGDIASRYGTFKCKEAADAMSDYLKKQKQEFKYITMYYPSGGTIISLTREAIYGLDSKESRISENGYHYGVEYNGNVFCNVHPFGLPRNLWEADFWGIDQASRIITPK